MTTARDTLELLRDLSAAVDASPDPIPDDYAGMLGQRSPTLAARPIKRRAADAGRGRPMLPAAAPPVRPWDSSGNGLPASDMAAWPAPPMLVTTDDADALNRWGAAAFVLTPADRTTPEAFGYRRVFPRPATESGRPRVAVWGGAHTPPSPHGSFLLATAAEVSRHVVEALDASAASARPYRAEAAAYRRFADAAESRIGDTLAWTRDPFIAELMAEHDRASATPARPAPVAATAYGTATAGPSDRPRNGRGRP